MIYADEDFEFIYQTYFTQLSRYVYFKAASLEDAQDIVQEVFLDFYRYVIKGKKDIDQVQGYLMSIAKNRLSTYYKDKNQQALTPTEEQEHLFEQIPDEHDLESDVLLQIDLDRLWAYVETLKEIDQKLLVGHYRFEMSFRELSEQLNIPESTLKSRHQQLLKKIHDNFV